jgi:hypothetical protein
MEGYQPACHYLIYKFTTSVRQSLTGLANVVEDEGDFRVAEGHGHPLVSKK